MVSPVQGLQYGVSPKISRIGSRPYGLPSWSPVEARVVARVESRVVARVVSRMISRMVSPVWCLPSWSPVWSLAGSPVVVSFMVARRGLPPVRSSVWCRMVTVLPQVLKHSFLRCHSEVPVGNARQMCSPSARRLPPGGLSKMLCRVVCRQRCNVFHPYNDFIFHENVSSPFRDAQLSEKSLLRLTRRGGRQKRVRAGRL